MPGACATVVLAAASHHNAALAPAQCNLKAGYVSTLSSLSYGAWVMKCMEASKGDMDDGSI